MTQDKQLLLHSLAAGAVGRRCSVDALPDDVARDVLTLASQHKVLPLVFDALCTSLPDATVASVRPLVRSQVIEQTVKTEEFLRLYERLSDAGVRAVVVKGLALRTLYANGDMRPSADEDILVSADSLAACREVLNAAHFTTHDSADAFEQTFTSEGSTLRIELHTSLFEPSSPAFAHFNEFFARAAEHAQPLDVGGREIYTLEPTEHLLYLVLHAYKHFSHSGFGIRQVCDLASEASAFDGQIDVPRFAECCRRADASRFAAALFALAEEYLGLPHEIAAHFTDALGERPRTEPLLSDIFDSGVYGSAESSRVHSAGITLGALEAQNGGKSRAGSRLRVIFPSLGQMRAKYPYLTRHPHLLPAAYVARIFSYLRRHGRAPTRAAHIGEQRLALLREYGIIKERNQ